MNAGYKYGFTGAFRALGYRNFRLFFAGQGLSLIGTWMQYVAMGWLIYRLTNSPLLLGLTGFASQIPAFILSPLGGVMADHFDRRRILIITQILSMLQAFAMAWLTLAGVINVWQIIALGMILGCVNALDIPVRQSFLVEMIDRKKDLGNAIALNSLMFNSARLIGPSIAGILIAVLGEGACFLVNGASFVAVIISLSAMRLGPRAARKAGSVSMIAGIRAGFSYALGFLPIKMILSLLGVTSLMGMSYAVLLPVFARDLLHGGPETLGFLTASAGVGALAATLYLASRKTVLGLGRMIPRSAIIFSAGLMAFSVSRSLWLSVVLLAVTGFGMMVNMASSNIILQTITDDDKRGRVMSLYTMAFIGMSPIGSLLVGSLASKIGVTNTLIAGGAVCITASLVFASKLSLLREAIHPIYRKIGIIPEVASGIGSATQLTIPPEE